MKKIQKSSNITITYVKVLFLYIFFIYPLFNIPANAAAITESDCIDEFKEVYGNGESNNSVNRACKTITEETNTQGIMWFNKCIETCPSGSKMGSSVSEVTPDASGKVTIGLHTLVATTPGNSTSTYFYAGNFNFMYNDTIIKLKNDEGILNYEGIPSTSKTAYTTPKENTHSDWKSYKASDTTYKINQYLNRGSRNSNKDIFTSLSSIKVTLNINSIRKQINKPNGNITLSVYRCYMNGGSPITSSSPIKFGRLGACGKDDSTLVINEPDVTEIVTMETGTKFDGDTNYDYTNADRTYEISGRTEDEVTATVYFNHRVTSTEGPTNVTLTSRGGTHSKNGNSGYKYKATVKLGFNDKKKVCEYVTFEPKTYKNGEEQSDNGTTGEKCVTVKRTDTKEVKTDKGSGTVTHNAADFKTNISGGSYDSNGIYIFDANYTNQVDLSFSTKLSIQNNLNTKTQAAVDAENITSYETIKFTAGQTGNITSGTSSGGNYNIQIPKFYLFPGETKEVCVQLKIDPSTYTYSFTSSETIINGSSQGVNYNVSESTSGTKSINKCITVYRMTEINTSTEINLKSEWNVNSTRHNLGSDGITHTADDTNPIGTKIYSSSKTGEAIDLNYTYKLNYEWLTDTYSTRLTNYNTINWWSYIRNDQLQEYSLTINKYSDSKSENDPDWRITNIEGAPSNNNESDKITLGSIQEYCRSTKAPAIYEAKYQKNPTQKGTSLTTATICAKVYRPWNYNLSFTSIESTSNGGKLYLNNETTSVTLKLQNKNNVDSHSDQEGNPSYSPETTISLYQITIPDNESITDVDQYIRDLEDSINAGSPLRTPSYIAEQVVQLDPATPTSPQSNKEILFDNVTFTQASIGDHICLYAKANHTNSYEDTKSNSITYYGTPKENALYSSLTCFTVAGFPTFQIRGGSILTEGDVKAKVVESNGEYFGSWIDYGLITKGEIKRLSSGKAFIGSEYKYDPDENRNKNHPLTIANNAANSDEPKGQSNISASATKERLKTLYSPVAKNPLSTTLSLNNPESSDGKKGYDYTVDISDSSNYDAFTSNQFTTQTEDLNARYRYTYIDKTNSTTAIITQNSPLAKGVTHVIYSTGNIVINSDLTYQNEGMANITDIPQYIIISEKNIYIDQAVKEVHAWLIADGEVNTCSGYTKKIDELGNPNNGLHQANGYGSASYYSGVCDTALSIYGPIFANNIWLERTAIGGTVSGVSELVNLTAENYYWALAQSKGNGKISTSYTRSLAPRY